MEYLHGHRIIYRDLKAENVLVWNFPNPFGSRDNNKKVDIKLADYGMTKSKFIFHETSFCNYNLVACRY